jgi:hypothetical protein
MRSMLTCRQMKSGRLLSIVSLTARILAARARGSNHMFHERMEKPGASWGADELVSAAAAAVLCAPVSRAALGALAIAVVVLRGATWASEGRRARRAA